MTLAIRVKRRRDEDPAATLAVKRQRGALDVCFEFAGTLSSADDAAVSLQLITGCVPNSVGIKSGTCLRLSEQQLLSSARKRKYVSSTADAESTSSDAVDDTKLLRLVDVQLADMQLARAQSCITCNDTPLEVIAVEDQCSGTQEDFVYDIYYNSSDFTLQHWLEDDWMHDSAWRYSDDAEVSNNNSDDSNAEDNVRNDYPEEANSTSGSQYTSSNDDDRLDYAYDDDYDYLCNDMQRGVNLEDVQSFSSTQDFRKICASTLQKEIISTKKLDN